MLEFLRTQGASFFPALQQAAGAGFFGETLDALWELVWAGLVTNDTLQPTQLNFVGALYSIVQVDP